MKNKTRKEAWGGMNWIRQEKRLAIYLRDGLACVYCGDAIESGVNLSLDHIKPHSKGGSNDAKNLVTACDRCNASRGNRNLKAWTRAVAAYLNHGIKSEDIYKNVIRLRRLTLPLDEAKKLIAKRGSALKFIESKRLNK